MPIPNAISTETLLPIPAGDTTSPRDAFRTIARDPADARDFDEVLGEAKPVAATGTADVAEPEPDARPDSCVQPCANPALSGLHFHLRSDLKPVGLAAGSSGANATLERVYAVPGEDAIDALAEEVSDPVPSDFVSEDPSDTAVMGEATLLDPAAQARTDVALVPSPPWPTGLPTPDLREQPAVQGATCTELQPSDAAATEAGAPTLGGATPRAERRPNLASHRLTEEEVPLRADRVGAAAPAATDLPAMPVQALSRGETLRAADGAPVGTPATPGKLDGVASISTSTLGHRPEVDEAALSPDDVFPASIASEGVEDAVSPNGSFADWSWTPRREWRSPGADTPITLALAGGESSTGIASVPTTGGEAKSRIEPAGEVRPTNATARPTAWSVTSPVPTDGVVARLDTPAIGVPSEATQPNAPLFRGRAELAEKIAGEESRPAALGDRSHDASFSSRKKSALTPGEEEVAESETAVGTEAAKSDQPMLFDSRTSRSGAGREESFSAVSGIEPMAGRAAPAETPAPAHATKAATAVEAVREVLEVAEQAAATRSTVDVKLQLDHARVSVRVEYRNDEVHVTFRTDSAEMREALSQAWHSQTASAERKAYTFAEPVFAASAPTPVAASSSNQGFSLGDGSRQQPQSQSQQQQSRSSEPGGASFLSTLTGVKARSTSRAATEARPVVTADSSRLQAFA